MCQKTPKLPKPFESGLMKLKGVGHVPGTVPFFVYEDLLSGGLVVESVSQESAQEVVYNTAYTYAKNFLQESVVLEFEDEDEDPVVDSEYAPTEKKTLAIVPGAFKPPHQGHG